MLFVLCRDRGRPWAQGFTAHGCEQAADADCPRAQLHGLSRAGTCAMLFKKKKNIAWRKEKKSITRIQEQVELGALCFPDLVCLWMTS